jgi:hypothetical protein
MFADHVAEHTLNDLQRYGPPKVVGGHDLDPPRPGVPMRSLVRAGAAPSTPP